MRPKTIESSDLARLLQHQRTSHVPRLFAVRSDQGWLGRRTHVAYAATPRTLRYASSELLARTSRNHVTATRAGRMRGVLPEECGKAGLVKGGGSRWMRGGTSRPNAGRHGRTLDGDAPDWISVGEGWRCPRGEMQTPRGFRRAWERGLDTDRFRLASNQSPGPARNDPALIRGGIGTASGVVTPSRRGQPVASALQRISCRCQIVVNIWDKRPLAATGVAVDRPPATQGTWRIGGRGRRV